ncbi:Vam6p NDAI_0D04270 [Naumovozyma dairenensis CBS 421]|uniref:Vacuolar sorting protein 39/Transforming growth factor beta receptor-associated domain-containing protein n=1 Tax=Naumovozyma dairenensis (strain ATCC 10597 / BCRC 20456 / CBS 421 / NBRC 0211 / NRRL Y-12639) TaxID=1071378 RepID=G0WAD0_NAUDC|nr:hypothetical protein NDAI_0D04270 [Naumovozyma dairenensis CBS 421]CCD24741.1 hypothetical protein NDAI_0D04270 [Naumovozyma dairenensis CBS 421]
MLRARKLDSFQSPGINAILPITESEKLIISKKNGEIEVYIREDSKYRLFQTFPNFLANTISTNDKQIENLYYSERLATIFVHCNSTLLLLNSTNLQLYDRIHDKRGIKKCWLLESYPIPMQKKHASQKKQEEDHNDDDDEAPCKVMTFLLYVTTKSNRIRLLIWDERHYQKMVEIGLPSSKETLLSAEILDLKTIVLATNKGIYTWSYYDERPILERIDKIVRRKYPKGIVPALKMLEQSCKKFDKTDSLPSQDNDEYDTKSISRLSRKSSISTFWNTTALSRHPAFRTDMKYIFKPNIDHPPVIIDWKSGYLFNISIEKKVPELLLISNNVQFFEWNSQFPNIQYLSSDILIMNNSKTLRFVDYRHGFTFLEAMIEKGIKKVVNLWGIHFLVWTNDDEICFYKYQVDDGPIREEHSRTLESVTTSADQLKEETESICSTNHNSSFNQLWHKVIFYKYFLNSPSSLELCESNDPEQSLDICAMKLRDYTVIWCLSIVEKLRMHISVLKRNGFNWESDPDIRYLQNYILKGIFETFTDFWAPPQLVILKTFPYKVARLVEDITGQIHSCFPTKTDDTTFEIPPTSLRNWCVPYLIDMRRHIKNLIGKDNKSQEIIWHCYDRSIKQTLEFFLVDKHDGNIDTNTMLKLLDMVLFEIYFDYAPNMVGPFISVPNMCDFSIVFDKLKSRHMFQELIDFSYLRGEHDKALEFLTNLENEIEFSSKIPNLNEKIKALVTFYLKKLPNEYLETIFKYTNWLLEHNKNDSHDLLLLIFLNDSITRDASKVYEYINDKDKELSLQYLEFTVGTLKSNDPMAHMTLIERYLENLNEPTTRNKLQGMLEKTSVYEPRSVLELLDDKIKFDSSSRNDNSVFKDDDDLKFVKFLKTYSFQRLNQHEESIDLLFTELSEYKLAAGYCSRVYEHSSDDGKTILLYLFKKITAIKEIEKMQSFLIQFLEEFSCKLDVIFLYRSIPSSCNMKSIGDILLRSIKSLSIKKDEKRMLKNLLHVELINITNELWTNYSQYGVLNDSYKCSVCRRNFSTLNTDTVCWFTIHGKNVYTHSSCAKTLQKDTGY